MKLLIVDDHAVVREGLRKLLVAHFDATVLEAGDVAAAFTMAEAERPDAVILDLNLDGAGGLEFLRRAAALEPAPRVIVFSMHHEPVYAVRALRGGAKGYVSKSAPVEELVTGIRKIIAGEQYIDRDLASRIAVTQISATDPLQTLSMRELEILRMLGEGKSMTAISEHLGIAYKTVANICTQIKVKLGVERTADLIRLALDAPKV